MIIKSLLDTDLYKFTMQQVVLHRFPAAEVEYEFKCRNKGIDFEPYLKRINEEIDNLCSLRFAEDELDFLRSLSFIKNDYVDFLSIYQLNRKFIDINVENGELNLIIKGPWLHTILFEVPLLAIVNEVFFEDKDADYGIAKDKLEKKIEIVKEQGNSFRFADFGTRRRRSLKWHEEVVKTLVEEVPQNLTGTSNVYFAKKYNLTPIGTMAHEFLQYAQGAGVRLVDSQKYALEQWVQEYRGELGIALSDVVGVDAFLRDFDLYFSKLFDGVRHDSGDPFTWCDKVIAHYKEMKIDPTTKTAVFSDGLNFELAIEIAKKYAGKINVVFGIGTNLTNDFTDKPLQIVIKMVEANGQPVAKLSDSKGKMMCRDDKYVEYLKMVYKIS